MSSPIDVSSLLSGCAARHPDRVAFIDDGRTVTYAEFARMCDSTAAWLARQGVGPGDRVAVWLVNRLEWLALYFALSRLDAALVSINTRYRSGELGHILARSAASLLVLEPGFRKIDFPAVLNGVDRGAAASLRQIIVVQRDGAPAPDRMLDRPVLAFDLQNLSDDSVAAVGRPDSLNAVFTTSGTTSGPKLVAHSQRTVTLHSQYVIEPFGLNRNDAWLLAALPFCGVFGFDSMLGAFAAGAPVVIMDTFDAARAVDLVNRHQVTHMFGSDEMFRLMLDSAPEERPFPSARVFGFAAFNPGARQLGLDAWERGVPLCGLYGSSEVHALFSGRAPDTPLPGRLGGGGFPCNPGAELRVRDVDSGAILPLGERGVIEIRASTNFVGYLGDPEATRSAVSPDGFFGTGDVGYLCDDGSFVYEMRNGDAIRLGGYLVSPVEIEDALKQQPGIGDAQVVAVDLDGHSRCVAFVIPVPGETPQEDAIKAALGAALAAYKVPAHVWAIDKFPTAESSNGTKIQRGQLREMAKQRLQEPA